MPACPACGVDSAPPPREPYRRSDAGAPAMTGISVVTDRGRYRITNFGQEIGAGRQQVLGEMPAARAVTYFVRNLPQALGSKCQLHMVDGSVLFEPRTQQPLPTAVSSQGDNSYRYSALRGSRRTVAVLIGSWAGSLVFHVVSF